MKKYFEKNGIEIVSTENKGKLIIAERFIRTFRNRNYRHLIAISRNICIDKLCGIVSDYRETSDTRIEYTSSINKQKPKFEIDHHARISNQRPSFAEEYVPNWIEDQFGVLEFENAVSWANVTKHLSENVITERNVTRIEGIVTRKCCKLFLKWKA